MLDKETIAEIDRVSRFPFLAHVGEPYTGPHIPVKSWENAEKKHSSARWVDFEFSCSNRFVPLMNQARRAGPPPR